ncbi:hypothetical protein PSHT_12188 [Puccinia striiformis]|uniref:Uncharacterized protein n=3 Tax=Puccinia striiformis TaxID=27350 RepID=A0A0L0VP04_9BASI|nr:hypothetical protein H4Q26_009483 [Puccinia striiformis f. sp. tritici PST-130]KAI9624194.1 hypothetical protein KEM48_009092 [Puccinia striiformis f. sp. tritici PST-130]KNF00947.1 hypothetical protein PSTG_05842 [Puccinia striiformis f. sp. tritici PST-78]POW02156.1 hypothetical protein PSHT_12188 [Puccinia striiformis]POW16640.1 hypothetical protein PSTT_01218 [Puccinia striiformis]
MQFAYDVEDPEGMAQQIQQQQARIQLYRNKLDEAYVDLNLLDEARMASLTQCHTKSITWHTLANSSEAIVKLLVTGTVFKSYSLPNTLVSNRLRACTTVSWDLKSHKSVLVLGIPSGFSASEIRKQLNGVP